MGWNIFHRNVSCPVLQSDAEWIEYNYRWLIENYGLNEIRNRNVVYINETHFPNLYKEDEISIDGSLADIIGILQLSSEKIVIEIDEKQKLPAKLIISEVDHQQYFTISLQKKALKEINVIISLICVQCTKIKLIESGIPVHKEEDSEMFIFLAMTFFGLGVLAYQHNDVLIADNGDTIPEDIQAYILAIFYWLRQEKDEEIVNHLSMNTHSIFKKSITFLHQQRLDFTLDQLELLNKGSEQLKNAWQFYNSGHIELAISLAKEAQQTNKHNPYIADSLAQFLIRKEQYEEAEPILLGVIDSHKEFGQAYNHLGFIHIMKLQMSKAHKLIKKSIALEKSNSYAYRNLGIYHTEKGDFDAAFKAFKKALKINPHTELLHYYTGMAMLKNNNKEGALRKFEKSADRGEKEGQKALNELQGYSWKL